ncbi:MAG TPA: DUF2252 domain-containing protein [Solirubrobacterales bacterium]|nr:DUF2252 domain-containing protein [Solirubrobacterales bacterium]
MSRSSHADWAPAPNREDPIAIFERQCRHRIPELLPIRYGRMLESPFAYLRGAPAAMAADLAEAPKAGLRVQACGDAHLMNFGLWATPERHLVFEVNDFDETLPASFEWDVKRLAASVYVAARDRGLSEKECAMATAAGVRAYRHKMDALSHFDHLQQWYHRGDVTEALAALGADSAPEAERLVRKAQRHTHLGALNKLTEKVSGRRRIVDNPPLVDHVDAPYLDSTRETYREYVRSLPEDRRVLLKRYRLVDAARKVVGVGSVGTDCRVALLLGDDDSDPLFLQIKEAERSILEPYAGRSPYRHQGRRVVNGQRLMQSASDIFLGWFRSGDRHYYVRQLRDMKGSADLERLSPRQLTAYAEICGRELARAHARGGDADAITGYLGSGDVFDRAVTTFARAYADQTEVDHAALVAAAKSGRIEAAEGI